MINVYTDVIQFKGSHYDFGAMQGELLQEGPLLSNRQKQWFSRPTHRFHINALEFESIISSFAPLIYEEIIGLQDSLQMNIEDAIRFFGGYYLEYVRSGCSIFTTDEYMVRNYDNDPLTYEGRLVLFQPTDGGYASIGPSMQITGRMDGINEYGLTMGYNFINTKQSADGFMCNMIGRIILETCRTVDEAVDLLKEIPHRHSFSYPLLDATGKTVVVEASPREVAIHSENICTNHFKKLTKENRYRMDDSIRRQDEIANQQKTIIHFIDAFNMMNDSKGGIFSTDYGSWSGTLHTAIYFPEHLQVGFAIGGDRLPYILSFKDWLRGKPLNVRRINGKLATKTPFVHMVKL